MSLKWRIALGYAALLIAVLVVSGAVIDWTFHGILYDQARAGVDATMHNIELSAQPNNPFSLEESASGRLQSLFESSNLEIWASPTTYVQVDSASGYPVAKSYNLGSKTIPANPALSAQHASAYRELSIGNEPYLVKDVYLTDNKLSAVVHVAQSLAAFDDTLEQTRTAIGAIVGAAAIAVVVFSIVLAAQATGPINELSREMREIGSDRLERRLGWRRRDEIGRLADSFDDLLLRLAEAFARERQFISDASHELKTPLTSINANAQMLLRWGDANPGVRRESLETIAAESATLAGMVNGMLTLAKADRGDDMPKEPVSIAQIASDVVQNAAPRAAEKHLELIFEHDGTPFVLGDAGLLKQSIANLVDNALKFTETGSIEVRVGAGDDTAWIEVSDSGPGIPEAERASVFDRFYRTDKARSREVPGTGLGLAIVRSIARVYGGEVTVGRSPAGGALFRIVLPRLELRGSSCPPPPQTLQ
ncbi:MAG: HAMP domain-containing histidine kinase [Candidatus Eremiobacteraeota bacterium]|nr:HAMP domain-containing histidine kinase [Candidatus Eremiobacteraeota bacterium]